MEFETTAVREEIRGIPVHHWQAFFGKKDTYYMDQLRERETSGRTGYNLNAFFLSCFWMVYRKMYLMALAYVILLLAEGTLEGLLLDMLDVSEGTAKIVDRLVGLVLALLLASFAIPIYLWDAERQIRATYAEGGTVDEIIVAKLEARGGTSWWPVLILLAVTVLLVIGVIQLGIEGYFR